MPYKAAKVCSCGKIVPSNMICACQQRRKAELDKRRPSASQRGYDRDWRKFRAEYLAAHPICVMILPSGNICGKPAIVVDHIIRHHGDKGMFWRNGNFQALCANCHNSRKQSQERRHRL